MGKSQDRLFAEEKRKHPLISFFFLLLIVIIAAVVVLNVINNSRVDLVKVSVTVPTLLAAPKE